MEGPTPLWFSESPEPNRLVREKLFHVTPGNDNEVEFIKYLGSIMQLDFWKPKYSHHVTPKSNVYFHADVEQSKVIAELLEKERIKYKIIFHDLQKAIENQFNKGSKNKKVSTRYREWKEIVMWAYSISLNYPSLASIVQIGNSYEGRPMLVLKIGNHKSAKKGVFLECGIHAREWISPAFCQWFATEDRIWRKNRAPTPVDKCIGTDLNRNFNASWNGIGFDDEPCSEGYAGTAPESAPEIKALTAYIRENLQSLKSYISFHSFSQLLLYPYGYTEEVPPNHEKLEQVAKSAVKALSSLYNTTYTYGPIYTTIYPACGSSIDWSYDEGIKYSFGFELRDEGQYAFLLPEHDIEPTCKETMLAVRNIASYLIDRDI